LRWRSRRWKSLRPLSQRIWASAGAWGWRCCSRGWGTRDRFITQLPFKTESIQAAITINTIYFIPELDRAFSELARVLTRPGRVVVGIGDPDAMAKMPMTPYGFRLRPVAEVTAAAESAGLALQDDKRSGQGVGAAHLLVFGRAS